MSYRESPHYRDEFFAAKFEKTEDGELRVRDGWDFNSWILSLVRREAPALPKPPYEVAV